MDTPTQLALLFSYAAGALSANSTYLWVGTKQRPANRPLAVSLLALSSAILVFGIWLCKAIGNTP